MKTLYLPYTLTLEARAVISATGGEPNSSRTLSYIPGSAVRGAVARALGDPGDDPRSARHRLFRRLVLGDRVRYLNAYLDIDGVRSLPAPHSLRHPKYRRSPAGVVEARDLLVAEAGTERLTDLPHGFVGLGKAQPRLDDPAAGARVHHQRDRQAGRAWTERLGNGKEIARGAVFAYEYLEAGRCFAGLIALRGEERELEELRESLEERLPDRVLVGRSRRGGYGGMARLEVGEEKARELAGAGAEGLAPLDADLAPGDRFRALLASPYLGRDPETGQIDPARLEGELLERLDLARDVEKGSHAARVVGRSLSFETAGGFNRKWRLELPQGLAASAGSVLLLEAAEGIPRRAWLELEHSGLGERRTEGYGRIAFLGPPTETIVLRLPASKAAGPPRPEGAPPAEIRALEQRILETKARAELREVAARATGSASTPPPNSLLGRLRVPLRQEPKAALEHLSRWLDGGEHGLKTPALRHLGRCRLGEASRQRTSLAEWLRAVIEDALLEPEEPLTGDSPVADSAPITVEKLLGFQKLAQRYHLSSESEALAVLRGIKPELGAGLIDAALASLALLNETKEGGGDDAPG